LNSENLFKNKPATREILFVHLFVIKY